MLGEQALFFICTMDNGMDPKIYVVVVLGSRFLKRGRSICSSISESQEQSLL